MRFKYHQPFELSARKHPVNGDLSPGLSLKGHWPAGEPVIIVMVHGFNVSQAEAKEGYSKLLLNLRGAGMPRNYLKKVCQFYWPGNTSNIFSRPSYPFQVKKAVVVANMLYNYLNQPALFPANTQFVFIAHSLGCRLVLEALKQKVIQSSRLKIKDTILMAAAVPVYMLQENGPLHDIALSRLVISGLHSENDQTLKKAFPTGQSAAGEGFFPQAVGYKGQPTAIWQKREEKLEIDHGQYWDDNKTTEFLARRIGVAVNRIFVKRKLSKSILARYKNGKLLHAD